MDPEDVTAERIMRIGQAYRESRTLLSAVELDVFTTLSGGPLDLETLKERSGVHARGARDFFDALVSLGMLLCLPDGRYANAADTGLYLDRNKPSYIGGLLESAGTRLYGVWGSLTAGLRTGNAQCDKSAAGNFGPLYADAVARGLFVSGLTAKTRPVGKALATCFSWRDYRTLIDVGTAEGCLPVEIAQAHPHITGGGFDLPVLGPLFDGYVQKHGLARRLRFYPGDFFIHPFPAADVLILGRVLHNWDLATKKVLLRKAYEALPAGGALIVYEHLIDDARRTNSAGLLSSLHMLLVSAGGFDFTGADCVGWMRETGFRETRVEPLTADQSMVVGIKSGALS
jgi:hypothetical protein